MKPGWNSDYVFISLSVRNKGQCLTQFFRLSIATLATEGDCTYPLHRINLNVNVSIPKCSQRQFNMLIASINNVYYIHWRSFFICIHTYKKAAKNSFGFYSCTIHSMGNADLEMATDKIKFIPQCLSIQKAAIKLDVAPKSICVPNSFYFIIFNFFCNPSNSWTVQAWSKAVTKRHLWNCQELRFRPESKSYKPQPWVLSPRTAASQETLEQPPQPTFRSLTLTTMPAGNLSVQQCQGHWHTHTWWAYNDKQGKLLQANC